MPRIKPRAHPAPASQLSLRLAPESAFTHGGARPGAGRKRTGNTRVPHRTRPRHPRPQPVHATLRAVPSLVPLRRERLFRSLRTAIERAHKVPSFRIVQFSVQSNHVHLIVEAAHKTALARGMQGLAIRLALTYNRVCVHRGSVWTERYHARELGSPRQVRNAFVYVLQNRTQYVRTAAGTIDPCSSAPWFTGWARPPLSFHGLLVPCPVLPAATWLASRGWRVHGLIDPDEVPLAARRPGAEVRRASRSSPPG